jgi:outer membrane protein TolC
MKRNFFRLLILTIGLSASALAQEVAPLKLDEAIETALKNNKEVILASLEQESSVAKYHQTNAVFLPQVNLSYTAFTTNNPLNAFGFKLQQQSITQTDFDPRLLNNPSATQNFTAKAEVNQPLINLDMIYARKAAHEQIDLYSHKTKRTKEYVTFEVHKAYEQLQLAHDAVKVLTEALQTVNSIYTSANQRFEKGFLQKSDVLQVQVQVNAMESKLAEAKSNVQNASDYLSLLMGAKTGKIYSVDSIGKNNAIEIKENQVPDDRADFKAMQAAMNAQDQMVNSGRMAYLPKLNAFGNFQINDKSAFGFNSQSYLLGAQFSWNIFAGTASRNKVSEYKVERTKIEQQLSYQKEQSQLELNKTNRQLNDAAFAITQSETAVSQAEEALRILKNRFTQGLVTTNDLLQAQTILSQQKLTRAQAIFQYNTTIAYLQFLTSTSEK